jgi:hypothetical protein
VARDLLFTSAAQLVPQPAELLLALHALLLGAQLGCLEARAQPFALCHRLFGPNPRARQLGYERRQRPLTFTFTPLTFTFTPLTFTRLTVVT